jgi:hypothetical protein
MYSVENAPGTDYSAIYARGNRTFSLLFTRWMDTNGWSHPVMVLLAKGCLDGMGWLHSSQISSLRQGKTVNPGPRTFYAVERLNYFLHRYATERKLIPGTSSSNFYADPWPVTENGAPPGVGWWVEIFCGVREPADIDLRQHFFTQDQADELTGRWATLVRKLLRDRDLDLITDLDRVLRQHYPARDVERVESLREVIIGKATWGPDALTRELPAISTLTAGIGGPVSETELLDKLKAG